MQIFYLPSKPAKGSKQLLIWVSALKKPYIAGETFHALRYRRRRKGTIREKPARPLSNSNRKILERHRPLLCKYGNQLITNTEQISHQGCIDGCQMWLAPAKRISSANALMSDRQTQPRRRDRLRGAEKSNPIWQLRHRDKPQHVSSPRLCTRHVWIRLSVACAGRRTGRLAEQRPRDAFSHSQEGGKK